MFILIHILIHLYIGFDRLVVQINGIVSTHVFVRCKLWGGANTCTVH